MICGLLTGTFFGMSWKDLFGASFPFPLLDPMKDQMTALVIYCGLGFAQIVAGMIVSMVLHIGKGDWQTAVFDIASWLMIFAGLAVVRQRDRNRDGIDADERVEGKFRHGRVLRRKRVVGDGFEEEI